MATSQSCRAPTRLATLSPLLHSCPQTPSAIFHHFAAFLSRPTSSCPGRRHRYYCGGGSLNGINRRRQKSPPTTIIARFELRPPARSPFPSRPPDASNAPFDRVIYYKSDLSLLAVLISLSASQKTPHNSRQRASERASE